LFLPWKKLWNVFSKFKLEKFQKTHSKVFIQGQKWNNEVKMKYEKWKEKNSRTPTPK
jgi:hypothetical protein